MGMNPNDAVKEEKILSELDKRTVRIHKYAFNIKERKKI